LVILPKDQIFRFKQRTCITVFALDSIGSVVFPHINRPYYYY